MKTKPFYSSSYGTTPAVYHDWSTCNAAQGVHADNRVDGTGDRRRCRLCASLESRSAAAAARR